MTHVYNTISTDHARRFYNTAHACLARADRHERQAKNRALAALNVQPGQRVLHIGVGLGREHAHLHRQVVPGSLVGLDLAPELLRLTRARADTPLCEGDARWLPFAEGSFDRLFSAYVLDLLPAADLPVVLREFRRVLRPGGRMALVSLTEGTTLASRVFVAGWKAVYAVRPLTLGGCRPLRLAGLVADVGFVDVQRAVVVQRAFPSEVVGAHRRGTEGAEERK